VEVVTEDSIGPWSSHVLLVLIALSVSNLRILLLFSVAITAAAPTVVLESEELVFGTSLSSGGVGVSVFLWTELEVSASIITVASHVSVGWTFS
jgi:hypothetical protein